MNREIKFRLWNPETKNMHFHNFEWGSPSQHGGGWIRCMETDGPLFVKGNDQAYQVDPNECEIMQYTGLKDKNGVEVYHDDIVKFTRLFGFQGELMNEWKGLHNLESINDVHGSHFLGQIVVDIHRGLMFKQLTTDYAEPLFTRHFKMMCNHDWLTGEVIGNIHQNPELLQEQK